MRGASSFGAPDHVEPVDDQHVGIGAIQQREQVARLADAARRREPRLGLEQRAQAGADGGVSVEYGDSGHRQTSLRDPARRYDRGCPVDRA